MPFMTWADGIQTALEHLGRLQTVIRGQCGVETTPRPGHLERIRHPLRAWGDLPAPLSVVRLSPPQSCSWWNRTRTRTEE
jgi:hypothetical protein